MEATASNSRPAILKALSILRTTFRSNSKSQMDLDGEAQAWGVALEDLKDDQIAEGVRIALKVHTFSGMPAPALVRKWALAGAPDELGQERRGRLPREGWWYAIDDQLREYAWHENLKYDRPPGLHWVSERDRGAWTAERARALDKFKCPQPPGENEIHGTVVEADLVLQ